MECTKCRVHMNELWSEPLGLLAKCPVCLVEVTLHFDRRKLQRDRIQPNEAA
jgi:hypothetical protein